MSQTSSNHSDTVLQAVRARDSAGASAVAASWCRSALNHGLDPEAAHQRELLGGGALAALREAHGMLLAIAGPVLDQTFRAVGKAGCAVILSDAQGVILERRAGDADVAGFSAAGLREGARWGEAEEGTNGIGTCLFEGRPVIVHRSQHFASRNIGISCMDAPVYDPHGRLIAALDVSSCRDDLGATMADMIAAVVRDAASRLESLVFCRHFEGRRIVLLAGETGTALLAVDRDDLVVGANRAARKRLGLNDISLAESRPLNQLLGNEALPSFEDGDRAVLRQALARADGNASQAARLLGIGRATLYRRMARAGLKH